MLYLAEDEKQVFIEQMKQQAFAGKHPVGRPVFTALVGAQGSGKSHLAEQIPNSVLISSDRIIEEFARSLDIDTRDDFYDKELGRFASLVNNEIVKEAIEGGYNVTYDTSVLPETVKMIKFMAGYGYKTDIKVMLVDEYQAAMNVAERKLDCDERHTDYRRNRLDGVRYPKGNPLAVMPSTSGDYSDLVREFVENAVQKGVPLEIYEFGKSRPSFKTGDDFDKFIENLQLTPMEEHIKRCEKLKRRADKAGNEEYFMQLQMLQNQMRRG